MVLQSRRQSQGVAAKPLVVAAGAEVNAAAGPADAELVRIAREGVLAARHEAFALLVTRYEGFVRGMLLRLCRNPAEADDLAQEAFITAWTRLDTLEAPERFAGWLKQLAYRQFLHRYRRRKVEEKHAPDGDEAVFQQPIDDDLERLLALCSAEEQELMILVYGFEFTYAEIASARGMAVGSVKSLVHRAKARIRQHLEEDEEEKSHG